MGVESVHRPLRESVPRMNCPIMVELIKKLDSVRAEQSKTRGKIDEAGNRKRLRALERFLDHHEQTCALCREVNPGGTRFFESSRGR
jgi:hypothetical protein